MPSPLSTDAVAYRRVRRGAVRWTAVSALIWLYVAACLVKAFVERNVAGAWVFLWWGLGTIPLVLVLRQRWRAVADARAVWLPRGAGPGALAGVPELDEPARPHAGLAGDIPPPRRW